MRDTVAEPGRCGQCRKPVLRALVLGFQVTLDQVQADAAAEHATLVAGARSFREYAPGLHAPRDAASLRADAVRPRPVVRVEHRCRPKSATLDAPTQSALW